MTILHRRQFKDKLKDISISHLNQGFQNALSTLLYLCFPHTWIPVQKHGLKQYFMGQYPAKFHILKLELKKSILDLQWVHITTCSKELCIYRQEN